MLLFTLAATILTPCPAVSADIAYLRQVAVEVLDSAKVPAGGQIKGGPKNETGNDLRVPGGTQNYYPAFWIRDAAMMLGDTFVPTREIEGWIQVTAATQPGPHGVRFPHGLIVPPDSIPDHVTLRGEACWYPGAYADQGDGHYGIVPPADDAFYFIQMVNAQVVSAKNITFATSLIKTAHRACKVYDCAKRAFDSVEVDQSTDLVQCDAVKTRVDWGFCDSTRKTGLCLMPSLLRWQAARRLSSLARMIEKPDQATYDSVDRKMRASIEKTFLHSVLPDEALLWSATGIGKQDDIWAEAFAVWLHILPKDAERKVATHLLRLYVAGKITSEGQVRHLPQGEYWEQASSGHESYQNGGYWATATGWLAVALATVDRRAGQRLIHEYVDHLKARRADGAPYEWINPSTKQFVNAKYASSAGLVYISLTQAGWR